MTEPLVLIDKAAAITALENMTDEQVEIYGSPWWRMDGREGVKAAIKLLNRFPPSAVLDLEDHLPNGFSIGESRD